MAGAPAPAVQKAYDQRRLSYAGTFTNPWKANTIRAVEWLTAKPALIGRIRRFERQGVPFGQPFFPRALQAMGIRVLTPPEEVALIPPTGPLVVVANHPHGLVDGLLFAELIGRVRTDYRILTRSLLTGIPEIAEFLIPVPFPHEPNSRAESLAMRAECMAVLKRGGVIALFPAGRVATSVRAFGTVIEPEWNPFTAKMLLRSGASVLPIYFPGRNSRLYHVADKLSATLRQGLLLHEIRRALDRPQRPVIGAPIPPEDLTVFRDDPRGMLAMLRAHTLALAGRLAPA
jgi:putative hemolysin